MNLLKTLDNFEPFNDLWYDKCYFHALFPIILHFNQDICYFLCNNIFAYNLEQKGSYLMLNIMNLAEKEKSVEDILSDMGITLKKSTSEHIVTDLIASIDNSKPVILGIDCFYESIRLDAYLKHHWPHDLLIYGYDIPNQTFDVIEHDFRDSFQFRKRIISFNDLENSYYGYHQNISNSHPNYYEFSLSQISLPVILRDYNQIYIHNLKKYEDMIFHNLEYILLFRKEINKSLDISNISSYFSVLLASMNDIINRKKIHKYSLSHILNLNDEIVKNLDDTINTWTIIRGIIGKDVISSKYRIASLEKVADKMDNIYKMERCFILSLYDFIK